VAFATDDLTAWLIGMLADAGRGTLVSLVFGSKLERALSSVTGETVRRTAEEVYPDDPQRAGDVALAITEVFAVQAPAGSLARGETTLELLRAGVARQLAVLDDPELTGTGQSSAEVLGVRAGMLAEKLADHLVSAILARGSRGGPLLPLANQLNHDLTHLNLEMWDAHAGLRGGQAGTTIGQHAEAAPSRRLVWAGCRCGRSSII